MKKERTLYILKYLCEYTDKQHPATVYDIIDYLGSVGIEIGTTAGRRTIAADIEQLQECGYDVVCNKGQAESILYR